MRLTMFKPLHGWRAFVGEIGVVTLGVLIALVAQQAAQEIDWRNRVRDARGALRQELASHYRFGLERRMVEPCIAAQLDALERLVLASDGRLSPAPSFSDGTFRFVIRVPNRNYVASAWQGALAEGTSSHLPSTDRARLAEQYGAGALATDLDHQLDALGNRLEVMNKPLPLDPGVRLSLLTTISEMRNINALLGLVGGQIAGNIEGLHMVPPVGETRAWLSGSGTRLFCQARRLPLRSFTEAQAPLPN